MVFSLALQGTDRAKRFSMRLANFRSSRAISSVRGSGQRPIPCHLFLGTLDFPAMPSGEYERYRQHLDAQLRADVELIHEAYRAKLRAYETVARARGEEFESLPAADLSLGLPPAAPAPPALVRAPEPPAPRTRAFEVEGAVLEILGNLPEVFDKFDLGRALGFDPRRSTLHRALRNLVREGALEIERRGTARLPTCYRKSAVPT